MATLSRLQHQHVVRYYQVRAFLFLVFAIHILIIQFLGMPLWPGNQTLGFFQYAYFGM